MDRLELVIFDMDGLMFDSEQLSYRCFKEVLNQFGYELSMDVFHQMLGVSIAGVKKLFIDTFGDDVPFDEIVIAKVELARESVRNNGIDLKPGLQELVDFLAKKGIKKMVATSSHREVAVELMVRAGVYDKFDGMICGDEITRSKPDPEIFLKAVQKANAQVNHCLVLEDSQMGILAASRAQIQAIMVPDMLPADETTKQLYFKEMKDLHEVKLYLEKILGE